MPDVCQDQPIFCLEEIVVFVVSGDIYIGSLSYCGRSEEGTGTAADKGVQVAPVLAAVQTNGHILRQNFVLRGVGVGVFPVDLRRGAPLGRAVFLPPAVIALGGELDADGQRISQKQHGDHSADVCAEYNMKRVLHCRPEVPDEPC